MILKAPPKSRHADNSMLFAPYLNIALSAFSTISLALNHHCDGLATADRNIFLHAILSAFAHVEALPPEDEVSEICADEDADDDVSVVIHCEQHNEVCNRKL